MKDIVGKQCPFGLEIPRACKTLGGKLSGVDETGINLVSLPESESDVLENEKIMNLINLPKTCPYAKNIKEHIKCCYGETGQIPLNGNPSYPNLFNTNKVSPGSGDFGDTNYHDDNIAKVYYGIYSYNN